MQSYTALGGGEVFSFMNTKPEAYAKISGYENYSTLEGDVQFYEVYGGTIVTANIRNLPKGNGFHGFHIHVGGSCSDPGSHYTKDDFKHPNHSGDMPPLLACNGMAFSAFYTNRFYPEDVVGRTVIIHENRDDFTTQPSGDAGAMIACGEIVVEKPE